MPFPGLPAIIPRLIDDTSRYMDLHSSVAEDHPYCCPELHGLDLSPDTLCMQHVIASSCHRSAQLVMLHANGLSHDNLLMLFAKV